jgi:hypothetical protein
MQIKDVSPRFAALETLWEVLPVGRMFDDVNVLGARHQTDKAHLVDPSAGESVSFDRVQQFLQTRSGSEVLTNERHWSPYVPWLRAPSS